MYSVLYTPAASAQIAALPQQDRDRLRRTLRGIAETARDVLLLQSGVLSSPARLVAYLGEHLVWYELDHERRRLTVDLVEPRSSSEAA
jgi:mRNA-degrading endonuclease RelE of RelBE toxin-antitoxin system